jgi:hypothetical protein
MPDVLPGGFQGVRFRLQDKKAGPQDPCTSLTPGSPSVRPTPALVARAQGGITLSLEEGELDADFCKLGKTSGFQTFLVL